MDHKFAPVYSTTDLFNLSQFRNPDCKHENLKVIASAGSDEQGEYMKSIGADVALNYKTIDTAEVLGKEGPIDWSVARLVALYQKYLRMSPDLDNVGGATLRAALIAAKKWARFIIRPADT